MHQKANDNKSEITSRNDILKSARDYYIHFSNVRLLTANISISASIIASVQLYINHTNPLVSTILTSIIFFSGWLFFFWLSMLQAPYYKYEVDYNEIFYKSNDKCDKCNKCNGVRRCIDNPKIFAVNNSFISPSFFINIILYIFLFSLFAFGGYLVSIIDFNYSINYIDVLILALIPIVSLLILWFSSFLLEKNLVKFNKAFLQEPFWLLLCISLYIGFYSFICYKYPLIT